MSFAETSTMPLASMSKVTSICGIPLGAGGMPTSSKRPSVLFPEAISRSPWRTWIVTAGWLSSAVEKVWLILAGIVVFFSINLVITPPKVSMPRESGVTSSSRTSLTSPFKTAPWMAAPRATTSSGFTPLLGSLPKIFLTRSWTAGMRVMPPTRITSLISPGERPASFRATLHGPSSLSSRSLIRASSLALVTFMFRCFGPLASAVINGRFTSVSIEVDSSIFAFSAASLSRCKAILSFLRSIPWSFLNSSAR